MEETFIYRDVYVKIVCVDASKHMYTYAQTTLFFQEVFFY